MNYAFARMADPCPDAMARGSNLVRGRGSLHVFSSSKKNHLCLYTSLAVQQHIKHNVLEYRLDRLPNNR
jgi:hypothetical protein